MTNVTFSASELQHEVKRAVRRASPFVKRFARLGYAAKGLIYILVGALATMAAFGYGGRTDGSHGALHTLLGQPFGRVLVAAVGFGIACYAIWQFMRAIEDPENEGTDGKAIGKRAGYFISAVAHSALVVYAIHLATGALGRVSGGGDDGAASLSAYVMSYPAGRWLVGAIGLGILIYGLWHLYAAYVSKLDKKLELSRLDADARRWMIRVSRFGVAARGVVFTIVGVFMMLAAYREAPGEARGLGGALGVLQQQPYGRWLLGTVALGLVAYGIYQLIMARYRRIETE